MDFPTPPLPLATAKTCLTPSMRLGPAPVGVAGRVLDVETQVHLADARQGAQRGVGFLVDLLRDAGLVGLDRQKNDHVPTVRGELDVFHDPEGNDVPAKARVADLAKLVADLFLGEGGGSSHERVGGLTS